MTKLIPSFRSQIFIVFLLLLMASVMFTRNFFIQSNDEFLGNLSEQNIVDQLDSLYSTFSPLIPDTLAGQFHHDIESLMLSQRALGLSADIYEQQVESYSSYIFIFVLFSGLVLFLLSISLITRPLRRLQAATQELTAGNYSIQIRENALSPINDLIVSFNAMVRDLNHQRELAIEAEKQLVWREVARVMAHEIKNPLTPIKLSIERLELRSNAENEIDLPLLQEAIGIIKEEVENLQSLVNRFRGFASLPKANSEQYNFTEQIIDVISAYKTQSTINLSADSPEIDIYADKLQMKQVLVNLIQNALQADEGKHPTIDISTNSDGQNLIIVIRDYGPGISDENMAKIFEPYFTTKRKGTGLGLPIVKRIIENHNGHISITSAPVRGTIVSITLPLNKNKG